MSNETEDNGSNGGAVSGSSPSAGSVNIHREECNRQVFDEKGEHWLDSFFVEIEVGVQSFDLAYEAETLESAEWYAAQLVSALSKAGMRVSLQNASAERDCPVSTGYVWRPEMPDREGCYKLKCDESKQQEFDVAITKAKDGSLYADSWMIGGEVPLVLLHRDLTNPQWAHLISVSHNK